MPEEPPRTPSSGRWGSVLAVTSPRSRKRALLLLAATAAGSALLIHELSQEERDRRAVRALVREIEGKVRAHDGGAWLLVEGAFPPGEAHPAVEAGHDRLRDDLDRLAHLDDLRLVVRDVRVQSGNAWVDYQVQGRPRDAQHPSNPTAGRFTFRRTSQGWVLDANRFGEGLPVPK